VRWQEEERPIWRPIFLRAIALLFSLWDTRRRTANRSDASGVPGHRTQVGTRRDVATGAGTPQDLGQQGKILHDES